MCHCWLAQQCGIIGKMATSALLGKPPMAFLKDPAGSVLVAAVFPRRLEFTREMFLCESREC
ncbi:MAG: hypothetical protein IH987_13840 [Planctomycetes bacterium]|nr:hypothetical protein [Planctomycetota bacterium]